MAPKKKTQAKPRTQSKNVTSTTANFKGTPKKKSVVKSGGESGLTRNPHPYRKPWLFGHNPDLEAKDVLAGYQFMLQQERNRIAKEKKLSGGNLFMRWLTLSRMEIICDVPEEEQSNFSALQFLVTSLQHGLVPPPWVAERILDVVNARSKNQIKSLDQAFGFSQVGKGKRVSQALGLRLDIAKEWVGKCVIALMTLGDTTESAISQVAHFYIHQGPEHWNGSAYDLPVIQRLRKGFLKDHCAICEVKPDDNLGTQARDVQLKAEEKIHRIYSQWLSKHPEYKNPQHPYRKSVSANGEEHFREVFHFK